MPISADEWIADIPAFVGLGVKVKDNINKLTSIPKADRKAVDYATCLGAEETGPLFLIAALIDKLDAQAKS